MIRRFDLVLAALGATLAAACGDAVSPVSPAAGAVPMLGAGFSWQCATATGVVAVEVAEGATTPTTVVAPDGHVVTQVAVKLGTDCWPTPEGLDGTYTILVGGAPCVLVEGLGTPAVTVTRIGTSPECRNVTHVEYVTAPRAGLLVICKELVGGLPTSVSEPFRYSVADIVVTIPLSGGGDHDDLVASAVSPLSCASAVELPGGSYAVTELSARLGTAELYLTSPAERLVSADYPARTATVLVVAGSMTTVTFRSLFGGDIFD